jgi:CheY-like chemotaxis protein
MLDRVKREPPSINGLILIVEDSDDDYFIFQRNLDKAGMSARHVRCSDGQAAKDYLLGVGPYADRRKFPLPRLILADLKMPRLNGLELLHWLRAEPLLRRIPFVLLTSSDSPEDIAAAYDTSVSAYVLKQSRPEPAVAMIKTIEQLFLHWSQPPSLLPIPIAKI